MKRAAGGIFILVGLIAFLFMQRNFRQAEASAGWPSVDGRIVVSKEVQRPGRKAGRPRVTEAQIEYAYRVGEIEYRGTQVSVGNFRSGRSAAPWLHRYPEGRQVTVYHNPADPSEAVLEPGVPGGGRWLYFGPVLLGLIGLYRLLVPGRGKSS